VTSKNATDLLPPQRKSTAAQTERPAIKYSASDLPSSPLTTDNSDATDLLLKTPRRSNDSNQTTPPADGREYVSNVQTIIFAAAAVATALVLPGIVSEIRRRRKRMLPQIPRADQRPDEAAKDNAATLPIREKAG
jgi:hypothetical protein